MRDQQKHRTALLVRLSLVAVFLLLVTLTPNWPQTQTSMAALTEPVSSLAAACAEDGETTISPSNVKTWRHFYSWIADHSYCSGRPKSPGFIKDSEIAAGSIVTGYKHFYDPGGPIFGCPAGINYVYNGTVLFDLSEIIDKAPPLHVSVTSATLHFTQQSGSCPGEVRIANEIWWTGYPENALVPGGPFARITTHSLEYLFAKRALCESGECTLEVQTVVNNWVRGAKHGGYANFGFVLKGIVDDDVHYEDEDSCLARYGDFSLTVHYKYDKPPVPTPTPVAISIGRPIVGDKTALTCTNFALASNGAKATAQKYTQDDAFPGLHFQPSYAIDGIRHTTADAGNYWRDEHGLSSWLQVEFKNPKTTIDEISVITVQMPGSEKAVDPTETQTFGSQGATAFDVKYWTGTDWANVPGGSIAGNSLVLRRVDFPPITSSMIRVVVNDASDKIARIVEVEACRNLVTSALIRQGEQSLNSRTDTAFGLITTTFDTLQGTVSVNLPDDVAAGDTISGTVITQPKGTTKDEQAKNEDSLNGYVVEVAKQETPTQEKQGSKWVIPPVAQFIPVVLKTREGEIVGQTQVPIGQGNVAKPKPDGNVPPQGGYSTPPFGQAGKPISVAGAFDGNFNNTVIMVGNNTAQFLAESPRKVVVRSPANVIGPATIEVHEQGSVVAKCNYQSIGVKLAAGKLNLLRGEQTILTVTLSGISGVSGPVPLQLTNASPSTIRMEGGESQIITAQPQEFTGGVFTVTRMLTGVQPGGFTINAVVSPTMLAQGGGVWKTCNAAAPGPENVVPRPQNAKAHGPENISRQPVSQ